MGSPMHAFRKKRKFIIFVIAVLIIFYLFITTISICTFSNKDQKRIADVAIVLGAGATNQGVSPVYRERINHGIWLYQNGYVKAIIVTGGIGKGNEKSDAMIAKQYAVEQGIPDNVIYAEELSNITQENIANAKVIMKENSLYTAIVVSDPLHMKRAMLMASDYGIDATGSPTPTTMYRSLKTKIPFLCREEFFYVGYRIYRIFQGKFLA